MAERGPTASAAGAEAGDREPAAGGRSAPEVVVALDLPDAATARELVARLPGGTWYKVGLELFTSAGPAFVNELVQQAHPVFLDLKLHDIPHTVAGAVRSSARLGVSLLTVHAGGGRAMLRAAAEAARDGGRTEPRTGSGEAGPERPGILAVTVLTSLDERLLGEVMGEGAGVRSAVERLAVLAREAGADGAVASVGECRGIKALCGEEFLVATPGIRPPGEESHDQKRVATPEVAAEAGADYLVVGRAVTRADDPAEALRSIRSAAGG